MEVSPLLAAVGTKASLSTLDGGKEVCKENTEWHLGAGGNIQAGYPFCLRYRCRHFTVVSLTLRATAWTDFPRAGTKPTIYGKAAYVSVSRSARKAEKKADHGIAYPASAGQPQDERDNAVETAPAEIPEQTVTDSTAQKTVVTATVNPTGIDIVFPVVYFDFNSISLRPSETSKLETILGILKEHPDMHIVVTGWCDTSGSRSVNERYSIRRAEAVKLWLESRGIAARTHYSHRAWQRREREGCGESPPCRSDRQGKKGGKQMKTTRFYLYITICALFSATFTACDKDVHENDRHGLAVGMEWLEGIEPTDITSPVNLWIYDAEGHEVEAHEFSSPQELASGLFSLPEGDYTLVGVCGLTEPYGMSMRTVHGQPTCCAFRLPTRRLRPHTPSVAWPG